jgi:hypothetical protein
LGAIVRRRSARTKSYKRNSSANGDESDISRGRPVVRHNCALICPRNLPRLCALRP